MAELPTERPDRNPEEGIMKTPTLLAIVLVALIISVPTGAKAFTLIDLSDSIEVRDSHGTVVGSGTVNESSPPIIETDKQGNIVAVFQRITFDVPLPTPGTGFQHRIFLTEPDGTISDEILIGTATQQSVLNVTLLSEVDGKPFPFRLDPTVPHIQETGDLQDLTAFLAPSARQGFTSLPDQTWKPFPNRRRCCFSSPVPPASVEPRGGDGIAGPLLAVP